MLVFDPRSNEWIIDPHYLGIIPLAKVYKTKYGHQKLLWMYHMYSPHSAFKAYANKGKSEAIVKAYFPKDFLDEYESKLQALIDEAIMKNQEMDAIADTEVTPEGEIKPKKKKDVFVPKLRLYDPAEEPGMDQAIEWYRGHLKKTPLWFSYNAYKEAMYNLSTIIQDPGRGASEIRAASQELDTLPLKMEKMRQQAEKDEAMMLQVSGDKDIKDSEKVETHRARQARRTAKT
jgi:hypothetical protein